MKRTFRPPLTLSHSLHDLVHWLQCLHDENQAARGHRGRRPLSLKKGARSEARPAPPRRFWHLARQRLGPNTSQGRPGARHPPLRRDSATLGRLPGDLRRRLDQDGQARSTRPARALPPGFFALAQPASPAAAPGTGSSPEEEVRLDSLGGWCLRYTRRPPDECMVALSEIARAYSAHHGAYSCPSSAQTPVHPAWALSSGAGPSAWTPTCEHDRRGP